MKIKKTVRRFVAFGVGAFMLGATVTGAMAASLSNYPDMFVTDGVFDGLMVVGENAAAIDNLAMTDIASSMKVSGATTTTVNVEGDTWLVGTASKKYEMANSNTTSSSVKGEGFREMVKFIDADDLDGLADGVFATNANSYDYSQYLEFGALPVLDSHVVKYDEDDDDVTGDFLFFKSGYQIANYKLEFSSTAQSDITNSDGTADTSGDYLDDFRNTDIVLFGQAYSIVEATRPASGDTTSCKLTLMAGSAHDTMLEGETKTFVAGDTEYEVSLIFVDTDKAKFVVNGETTSKLSTGETYVLADGSEIGVSEILYQAYAGGVHSAEFYVGATKIELRDDNVTVAGGAYNMKVGSEDIDGTTVVITGTDDRTTFAISTIEVNMSADDDFWVPAGGKLSESPDLDEPEVLFGGAFNIEYSGLTEEETHDLSLKTSGSRKYKLHLFDGDGNAVELPVAYADANYNISIGEDTWAQARASQKRLILQTTDDIYKNDYFVVTSGTPSDGSAKSYLLQFKGVDKATKTSPKIQFKNMGSGETLEYTASDCTSGDWTCKVATIKVGGNSFNVENASTQTEDDYRIDVDLTGADAIATAVNATFVDYFGSEWTQNFIGDSGGDGICSSANCSTVWTQSTPNADDYDNQLPSGVVLNITGTTDPELRTAISGVTLLTPDGETEVSYGYTSMGSFITFNEPSGDPDEFMMAYPKKQRLPQVYVTSGATTTTTSAGDLTAVTVVDATKLDSEVASVKAQNLIVVGGPCVNTVAAELLGNPAVCTEGFTPGKARVKLFEHANGNVAMLVAGYSGADTRLAGKVLAHRWTELSGTEVEIEGTTYSDATIGAPAAE